MPRRRNPGEVALYQTFDADGNLLYVGIADEPMRRWYSHTDREWWSDVDTYEVTWFDSRKEAEAAERKVIEQQEPEHNIVFNSVPYRGDRFPCMHLHSIALEHFGDRAFSFQDLEDQLGIPYGSAAVYGRRLQKQGAFRHVGEERRPRGKRQLFVAVPPVE